MTNDRFVRTLGVVTLAAIVVTALWSFAASVRDARRMPTPTTIAEGNALAMDELRDGDALRPYPRWFADARVGLDRAPILMGDPIDPWELADHRRLVQLVAVSHLADADREAETLGLRDVEVVYESDRYLVRRGVLPEVDERVVWDGLERLRDATVTQRATDASVTECGLWTRDAWHCQRPDEYIFVGRSMREMGDQNPHRCIMANPPAGGAAWVVTWPDVPAAGGVLRWRAGNEYMAIRSDRGAPVALRVLVDGEERYQRVFGIHDESYEVVEVPMPAGPTAEVTFELRADDHFDRFFCFRPQVVTGPQAGARTAPAGW